MQTDDLNIEDSLSFSEQQDGLIQGQQMAMQQVLADKQHLRTIIRSQKNIIEQLKKQIAQLQEENAQLLAENKELRERPNIVAEHYIEKQTIGKQIHVSFPATLRSARRKLNTNDQTQLPLWNNAALT